MHISPYIPPGRKASSSRHDIGEERRARCRVRGDVACTGIATWVGTPQDRREEGKKGVTAMHHHN